MSSTSVSVETFRGSVPPNVDDQTLRNLIKEHGGDQSAIELAISALWEDTAASTGNDWVTTSKSKKSQEPVQSKPPKSGGKRGSGRGERGRGSSANSGDKTSESHSRRGRDSLKSNKPTEKIDPSNNFNYSSLPAWPTAIEQAPLTSVAVLEASPMENSTATEGTEKSQVAWGGKKTAWGGLSLAEKLKRQEVDKSNAQIARPAENKEATYDIPSTDISAPAADATKRSGGRTRGGRRGKDRSRGGDETSRSTGSAAEAENIASSQLSSEVSAGPAVDLIGGDRNPQDAVSELAEDSSKLNLSSETASVSTSSEDPTKAFLKMAKWEAPVGTSQIDSYQFGFGALGTEAQQMPANETSEVLSQSKPATSTIWSENGNTTQTSIASSQQGSNVGVSALISSLETSIPSVSASATRAPPGLDPSGTNGATTNNATDVAVANSATSNNVQNASNSIAGSTLLPAANAYNQPLSYGHFPPGMQVGRSDLQPNVGPYGIPFDQSNQFMHLYSIPPGISQPPSTIPDSSNSSAAAGTSRQAAVGQSSANSASNSSSAPVAAAATPQHAPQQAYPAPTPFPYGPYGNPYYNPAYFYGHGQPPLPAFYGQGRGVYHQRGPYSSDPYGNNAQMYPTEMYAGAQFPIDGANSYHSMAPQGQGSNNSGTAGKHGKNNSAVHSNNSAGTADVNSLHAQGSNYGYMNPYNARGVGIDPQAWQYQQSQQSGWGAQMMQLPPNTPIGNNANGFGSQQVGQHATSNTNVGASGLSHPSGGGRTNGNGRASGGAIGNQNSW